MGRLLRFTTAGQPDPAFGNGGVVTPTLTAADQALTGYTDVKIEALQVRADDSIIVFASVSYNGWITVDNWKDHPRWIVVGRFLADGQPDLAVSTTGLAAIMEFGHFATIEDVGIRSDESPILFVSDGVFNNDCPDYNVLGFDTSLALDPGFGNGGRTSTSAPPGFMCAWGCGGTTTADDGALLAVIYNYDVHLVRFGPDGVINPQYGDPGLGGWAMQDVGYPFSALNSLILDDLGRPLAIGRADVVDGGEGAVARFIP